MSEAPSELKYPVLEFYRTELRTRYELDNVRRFKPFDPISDEKIVALRSYFMDTIYPPVRTRERLDKAIDHLGGVVFSAKRLRPLMGTALKSLWRLGRQLPSALSAGMSTVDAYREARKLESFLVDKAMEWDYTVEDTNERDKMVQLLQAIPDEDVIRLIKDLLKLFHALSNIKLLETAVGLMKQFIATMDKHPDLFTEEDLEGVTLGLQMLQEGLDLFYQLKPEDFPKIIKGIEKVEFDWYDRIKAEAEAIEH